MVQLTADGSAIRYSTYIGGGGDDEGYAVAAGGNGYLYTVGEIDSSDMPVHNAYQPSLSGGVDGYLVVVDPAQSGSASLVYATYLGGSGTDIAYGVQADSAGHAYVTGQTKSSNFPVANAYQPSRAGQVDAFVARFDPLAVGSASLLYSTFLGGSADDKAMGLALGGVDGRGYASVTGKTKSSNFPIAGRGYANAYQASYAGGSSYDVFVLLLDLGSNNLGYSTYLGAVSDKPRVCHLLISK